MTAATVDQKHDSAERDREAGRLKRKRRSKRERESQLAEIADLYTTGHSLRQIGERMGYSVATAYSDVSALREQWSEHYLGKLDGMKAEQLARLDRLEKEAWSAWFDSRRPTKQRQVEDGKDGLSRKRKTTTTSGDPRYLQVIHQCIASRRDILGLDAPKVTEHTGDPMVLMQTHVNCELPASEQSKLAKAAALLDG